MTEETKYFGVIDESELSMIYPRMIDGDEYTSFESAWQEAFIQIRDGAEKVSIGPVKYYGDDGNGYWGEDLDYPRITIDAEEAHWASEEEVA